MLYIRKLPSFYESIKFWRKVPTLKKGVLTTERTIFLKKPLFVTQSIFLKKVIFSVQGNRSYREDLFL